MIKNFRHCVPTIYCAFMVYVWLRPSRIDRLDALQFVFLSLPMCFVFAGLISYSMQKQIRDLQAEVRALRSVATEVRHDT